MYNNLNKIITLLALLIVINTQAMIVGFSSLIRHFNTQKETHKVILLYDQHALDCESPIKQDHIKDMLKLIEALTENHHNIPFLIELSERQKDQTSLQEGLPLSPGNIPIKLALAHDMVYKNISFVSFDTRKHCDYWMRDMLMQRDEFAQAISQNHQFPNHFYTVTGKNFLEHLKIRRDLVIDLNQKLPANMKGMNSIKSNELYSNCVTLINNLLQLHRCNSHEHLFNLIQKLTSSEKQQLYITTLEEQSFSVEINILHKILKLSKKNQFSIVLAGMYHSSNIEKWLLSYFEEFEKNQSQSMIASGLELGSLSDLKLSNNVPESFVPKAMQIN